jgi:PAS domain S-box-containing protein
MMLVAHAQHAIDSSGLCQPGRDNIAKAAGSGHDMTENANSFFLIANILDAYPDNTPIYVKERDGKYMGCSKGFLELLGLTSDEVIGKTAKEVFPADIAKEDEISDRSLQWVIGQDKMEVSFDINGKEHFLLFKKNGFSCGVGTMSGGVVGTITDITLMRNRTVQMEMKDALASISTGVYHDISNLLTPIDTSLSLIEDDMVKQSESFELADKNLAGIKNILPLLQIHHKDALTGKGLIDSLDIENLTTPIESFFSMIHADSAKHKRFLVLGIKALHRIKSMLSLLQMFARGKLTIKESDFSVNDVVLDVTSMIFPGSKIKKEMMLCENPWPINLDYLSIFRILLNLVVNSVQAMPNGGNLKCKTENMVIDRHKYVKITIADSGGGIPPEVLKAIDQPHASTKTDGHGFGLCVVSSLITKCGGKKEIISQPGHGTEFEVLVPVLSNVANEVKDILKKYSSPMGEK